MSLALLDFIQFLDRAVTVTVTVGVIEMAWQVAKLKVVWIFATFLLPCPFVKLVIVVLVSSSGCPGR